jgi:hypothetical protein
MHYALISVAHKEAVIGIHPSARTAKRTVRVMALATDGNSQQLCDLVFPLQGPTRPLMDSLVRQLLGTAWAVLPGDWHTLDDDF